MRPSFFSSSSAAVDISAPGEGILTAVPPALDEDGTPDGYEYLDGTSFAAPMVAAAAAWVEAVRPSLWNDQVADLLRSSAQDVETQGWDSSTGFGVLDIAKALGQPAAAHDPGEPNDDILWVDGSAFAHPDRPIYRSGPSSRAIRATLDVFEDPQDLYRISVPRRSRVQIAVKPSASDVDLSVFTSRARSTASFSQRIGLSQSGGSYVDKVHVSNPSRRAQFGYVDLYIPDRASNYDAAYSLRITRERYRGCHSRTKRLCKSR
jgi:hypothetical protein